jgi:hypothetical protein
VSDAHTEKLVGPIVSIFRPITTFASEPKHRRIETPAESRRNGHEIAKCEFPSSTVTDVRFAPRNAPAAMDCVEAGIDSDFSEGESLNTYLPNSRSCDPDSNTRPESKEHSMKHSLRRISTDAGMQIDLSEEQCPKSLFSIARSFDGDANVT